MGTRGSTEGKLIKKKDIMVVGTGTIGEPLIGLLCDFRDNLGIGDILFHKRSPLNYERPKVNSLISRGARLVVDEGDIDKFLGLGQEPSFTMTNALEKADIVIDCTPAGNENKKMFYEVLSENSNKIFIAQGSEKHFGVPYAHGINDKALSKLRPNFIQVVSCNTHNVSSLLKTLDPTLENTLSSDFVCIRRSNDISQEKGFSPSPTVDAHSDKFYGTHHAQDAVDLLLTVNQARPMPVFSSSMKLNTQYMHSIRFKIRLKGVYTREVLLRRIHENKFFATTKKSDAGRVFSFGRDHGYYGRLLNHGVLVEDTFHTYTPIMSGETYVTGFCFTPQDGNSLLSSVAATMISTRSEHAYEDAMKSFDDHLFGEI